MRAATTDMTRVVQVHSEQVDGNSTDDMMIKMARITQTTSMMAVVLNGR